MTIESTVASIVFTVFILMMAILGIGCYVFESIGLYTMSKRRGIAKAWLVWIPFGFWWGIGSLADQCIELEQNKRTVFRHLLLWVGIVGVAVSVISGMFTTLIFLFSDMMIGARVGSSGGFAQVHYVASLVGTLILLAVRIAALFSLHRIYKSCTPSSSVALLVLSIFFPIIVPFTLFALRNRDDGMPRPQPRYGGTKQ